MPTSTARIATPDGSRLIKRLCTHWAHKLEVSFDDTNARIIFDPYTTSTLAAEPDHLIATINAPDPTQLARIQDVVANHLDRMARGEPLEITWLPQPPAN